MRVQNSFQNEQSTLYIVPTPIGNLDDMTFRAIKTLKKVHIIAAEDTRKTRKLLTHFDIKNELISYHEHNVQSRTDELIEVMLRNEDVALVSDAGMPAISDPGEQLVKKAIEHHINVVVLPGANAAICALVGSGMPTEEFLFYGFLPRKNRDKKAELVRLQSTKATIIFYESPYRIKSTLNDIKEVFGNRTMALARELTKVYEQYVRGKVTDVQTWLTENEIKGECCLVVHGGDATREEKDQLWWSTLTIEEHVRYYEGEKSLRHKEALRRVAQDRNTSRRDIYEHIHVKEK